MGMLTAMYAGVAGLNVHGRALSSVADNIANLNTAAYKATRTNFGDVMVHSLTVGGTVVSQVGTGASVLNVQNLMTQGSFETTDIPTDLAISGSGFFQVSNPNNADELFYTRAGQFTLDDEGYLVNPSGLRLQGYNVDANGDLDQVVEDLQITTIQADAEDTNEVDLSVNLDAEDTDKHSPSQAIDPADKTTYNYMTTVRVYDSLGIGHDLSLYFQKLEDYDGTSLGTPKTTWKCSIYEGTEAQPSYPDNTFYLQFDTDGHLLGTTTGQPGYGDSYTSQGAVSSTTSEVSDRVGETFGYTTPEGGSQTYISTLDIGFGGATEGDETITIGSSYQYSLSALSAANAATSLAADINANGGGAIWATVSGTTVTVYNTGESAMAADVEDTDNDNTVSFAGDTLHDTSDPQNLVDSINNGRSATGAIDITGGAIGDTVSISDGTNTYTYTRVAGPSPLIDGQWSTVAELVDEINADMAGTASAVTGTSAVFVSWASVGTFGNTVSMSATGGITLAGLVSGTSTYLVGGMDQGGASGTMVTASTQTSTGGYSLHLARADLTSFTSLSTITISSSNTLGDTIGLDLDAFTQDSYAADAQPDGPSSTVGEHTIAFDFDTPEQSTAPQEITFDFSPSASSASTQSAGDSETFYLYQDGYPRGTLQDLDIDEEGVITGQFSNGTLQTLGAVVLANFANAGALERQGENLWGATIESGEAILNQAGHGGLGTIESGALEQSNVDLANEFVKMINYQRAFQANSRTISTTDDMLAELINLKR